MTEDNDRIAYLVKNALKHGLTEPQYILQYIHQQGYTKTTIDDIKRIMDCNF